MDVCRGVIACLVQVLVTTLGSMAWAEGLITRYASAAARSPLCGVSSWATDYDGAPLAEYATCVDLFHLIDFPKPPYYHEDWSFADWDEALPADAKLTEKLALFVMAELRANATLHRAVRYDISLLTVMNDGLFDSWWYCRLYLSTVDYWSEGGQAPGLDLAVDDFDTVRERQRECRTTYRQQLAGEFSGFASVDEVRSIIGAIDNGGLSATNLAMLAKIMVAIIVLGPDATTKQLTALVRNDPDYWHYFPDHFQPSSAPTSSPKDVSWLDLFSAENGLTVSSVQDNIVAIAPELSGIPPINREFGLARLRSKTFVADRVLLIPQTVDEVGISAVDTSSRVGTDQTIVANQVVIGDPEANPPDDANRLVGGIVLNIMSAQGPCKFSKIRCDESRSGGLTIVSPDIQLADSVVGRLRYAIEFFGPAFAPNGLDSIVFSPFETSIFLGGLDADNPYVQELTSIGELSLITFLPLWEKALRWQIAESPQSVISRYVYVDGDDVVREAAGSGYPQGISPSTINVEASFHKPIIPAGAFGRWKSRYLQELSSDLNIANFTDDSNSIVGVFERLNRVVLTEMPTEPEFLDDVNERIAALITSRNQFRDRIAVDKITLDIEGGTPLSTLTFTGGQPLRTWVAPSRALIVADSVVGSSHAGNLDLVETPLGQRIQLSVDVVLATDEIVRRKVAAAPAFASRQVSEGMPPWTLSPRDLPFAGVSLSMAQVTSDRVRFTLIIDPATADSFLVPLIKGQGVPIALDWSIVGDPSADSAIYGPIVVPLSARAWSNHGLSIVDHGFRNSGSEVFDIQYVCEDVAMCVVLDPSIRVAVDEQVNLPTSAQSIGTDLFVPLDAAQVHDDGRAWWGWFRQQSGSAIQNFNVKNAFLPDDEFGGAHERASVEVKCKYDGSAVGGEDLFELLPGGSRQVTCLRGGDDGATIDVTGVAFFDNGGQVNFSVPNFGGGNLVLNQGLLSQ